MKEMLNTAMESFDIEKEGIELIKEHIDAENLEKVIEVLSNAQRITTCASGSSGFAAMKFAHSLCCIERPAKFMSPAEAVHGGLGFVKERDPVIIVSRGGKTVELLPIIEVCVKKKAVLIAVTENLEAPLAKNADIILPLTIKKESDPLNVMATTSFVVTIALFDAILAGMMVYSDYKKEEFALIHPGGAVGKLLNS